MPISFSNSQVLFYYYSSNELTKRPKILATTNSNANVISHDWTLSFRKKQKSILHCGQTEDVPPSVKVSQWSRPAPHNSQASRGRERFLDSINMQTSVACLMFGKNINLCSCLSICQWKSFPLGLVYIAFSSSWPSGWCRWESRTSKLLEETPSYFFGKQKPSVISLSVQVISLSGWVFFIYLFFAHDWLWFG